MAVLNEHNKKATEGLKPAIAKHLSEIEKACQKRFVHRLYAFGSVNTERFKETSDIDLIVDFFALPPEQYADNYFDLCEDLEAIFNRKVDLVTTKSIKNPYFQRELEQTKQLIYAA